MIDARKLFISGKRYRGFAPVGETYIPVAFSIYPLDEKEVRLRHLFPSSVVGKIGEGSVVYALVEDGKKLVAELRVLKAESDGKSFTASVDYITKDRRALPRVRVEGLLEIEVEVRCGSESYRGRLLDISIQSLGVKVDRRAPCSECELTMSYGGRKINLRGRVIRCDDNIAVIETAGDNPDMVSLLGRIYSDIFLKIQRG